MNNNQYPQQRGMYGQAGQFPPYWAGGGGGAPMPPPQSQFPQQPAPTPNVNVDPALYANYGYGPQWQRQQQQQQQQNPFAFQQNQPSQAPAYSPFQPQISQPALQHASSSPFIQAPPQVYQPPANLQYLAIPQPIPQPRPHIPPVPLAPSIKRPRQDNHHPPSQPRHIPHAPRAQPFNAIPPRPTLSANQTPLGPKAGFPPRLPAALPARGLPNAPRNRFPRTSGPPFATGSRPGGLAGRINGKGSMQGGNRRSGPNGHFGRRHGPQNKFEDDARGGAEKDQHSRRDENRRSLTDFKVIGWCIPQVEWVWGQCKDVQLGFDGVEAVPQDSGGEMGLEQKAPQEAVRGLATGSKLPHEPPSRLRFYFHAPPEDVIKPAQTESQTTRGKRKKADDDDDEPRERNIRQRQLSEAPSVEMGSEGIAPSTDEKSGHISENDEGDWLMAAIGEGSDAPTPLSRPDLEAPGEFADNSISVDEFGDADDITSNTNVTIETEASVRETRLVFPPKEDLDGERDNGVDGAYAHDAGAKEEADAGRALDRLPAAGTPIEPPLSSDEMIKPSLDSSLQLTSLDMMTATDTLIDNDNQVGSMEQPGEDIPSPVVEGKLELLSDSVAIHSPALSVHSHSSTLFGSSGDAVTPSHPSSKGDMVLPAEREDVTPDQVIVSPNRLSILYAGSQRRLIVNAECVENVKLYRRDGRFEILLKLEPDSDSFKGISIEGYSEDLQTFLPKSFSHPELDSTIPPFHTLNAPTVVKIVVFLDTDKPLSEPGWCKSGNIEEWLKREFGPSPPSGGWENRIEVVDPDPALTLVNIVEGWCQRGSIGTPEERERFRKAQLDAPQTGLELLLRLTKGDRPMQPPSTRGGFTGPLLEASETSVLPGPQQTHVTLAVLSLANSFLEAKQANDESGRQEGYRRISEIVQHFPVQQIHRALESMFRDWRTTKKKM